MAVARVPRPRSVLSPRSAGNGYIYIHIQGYVLFYGSRYYSHIILYERGYPNEHTNNTQSALFYFFAISKVSRESTATGLESRASWSCAVYWSTRTRPRLYVLWGLGCARPCASRAGPSRAWKSTARARGVISVILVGVYRRGLRSSFTAQRLVLSTYLHPLPTPSTVTT